MDQVSKLSNLFLTFIFKENWYTTKDFKFPEDIALNFLTNEA